LNKKSIWNRPPQKDREIARKSSRWGGVLLDAGCGMSHGEKDKVEEGTRVAKV